MFFKLDSISCKIPIPSLKTIAGTFRICIYLFRIQTKLGCQPPSYSHSPYTGIIELGLEGTTTVLGGGGEEDGIYSTFSLIQEKS